MAGISLDYLCRDRAQTTSLEALSGSALGIEVEHYLRKLAQQSRSPLFTPWGGVAQSFFRIISHDLSALKELNIKPLFVFTGLQVVSQHESDPSTRLAARTLALGNLERKRNEETLQAFASLMSTTEIVPALKDYFRQQKVDYLVAPYFAGAQLAYMLRSGSVDSLFASPEVFVFGADRAITDISFDSNSRVTFCDKSAVLSLLQGITDDQFLDAYLFAGNEFCPIVPILEPNAPSEFSAFRMRAAADVVRQNGTGYLALHGNPALEAKPNYLDVWMKAKALFKYHPYLNAAGDVVLSKGDQAPSDVARVIGARLPREVYFYLSRGLIEPQLINTLLSGVWRETAPLDGGEGSNYRQLLDSMNDIRVKCMDLLHGSKQLHHYYEKKVVVTKKWYRGNSREPIEKLESPLYNELRTWQTDDSATKDDVTNGSVKSGLLKMLQVGSAGGVTLKTGAGQEVSVCAMQTNVLYKVLQLRGYIAGDQKLTPWGNALEVSLKHSRSKSVIPTFCALEMLRLGALNHSGLSNEESPKQIADARWQVLGRIAAVLPLEQNDAPWQGPIDREALAAFSLAQTTYRYLAALYEMTQLAMLLRGDVKRSEQFISNLALVTNPFAAYHDAGLSTYSRRFFSIKSEKTSESAAANIFDQLKATFPTSRNGEADVKGLFEVWDNLYAAIGSISGSQGVHDTNNENFDQINDWLTSHR